MWAHSSTHLGVLCKVCQYTGRRQTGPERRVSKVLQVSVSGVAEGRARRNPVSRFQLDIKTIMEDREWTKALPLPSRRMRFKSNTGGWHGICSLHYETDLNSRSQRHVQEVQEKKGETHQRQLLRRIKHQTTATVVSLAQTLKRQP